MGDYNESYLEGQYDEDPNQKSAQIMLDIIHAVKTEQEIKEIQQRAMEIHKEELLDLNRCTSDKLEELMETYNNENKLQEYLVDGALLTCTQATLEPFKLPGAGSSLEKVISLEAEQDQNMYERMQTRLNIAESDIDFNDLNYATVNDTVRGENIYPFHCNCRLAADRNEEREKILKNLEFCKKEGVCTYLMKLNEKWDNMPLEGGGSYLTKTVVDIDGNSEQVEGITRTSVLFCKHGGLLVPLTSGQTVYRLIYNMVRLEISSNPIALSNTSIEPADTMTTSRWTQGKIQRLCNGEIVYFDENGYQRVKNTGLISDPYLIAIAEYYSGSAVSMGVGDSQGYGAIFRVTFSSGKEIYVTMGDLKDPKHTKESMRKEQKNYYAGEGNSANTLEFICNYLNRNKGYNSENMSGKRGTDANTGKATAVTEKASITSIDLLLDIEIDWDTY